MENMDKFSIRVTCPVCKDPIPSQLTDGGRVLKDHGTYTLGAKKPFKLCKGSGLAIRTVGA